MIWLVLFCWALTLGLTIFEYVYTTRRLKAELASTRDEMTWLRKEKRLLQAKLGDPVGG